MADRGFVCHRSLRLPLWTGIARRNHHIAYCSCDIRTPFVRTHAPCAVRYCHSPYHQVSELLLRLHYSTPKEASDYLKGSLSFPNGAWNMRCQGGLCAAMQEQSPAGGSPTAACSNGPSLA